MDTDVHNLLSAHSPSLQRYLPNTLFRLLEHHPDDRAAIDACLSHLDALLGAVATYLPRYLVAEQLERGRAGEASGQFRQATIMFADIAGFTALSERLSRQGQQGAEAVTRIVGDCFTALLAIAERHGGDLLKFGGDALLLGFLADGAPGTEGVTHTWAACRAALEMQQAMDRFSQIEALGETFGLKMTVGLGSGSVFTANLGTLSKMEHTVMGTAMADMALAEDQAQAGEIYVDEATYQGAKDWIRVDQMRAGRVPSEHCYRLVNVQSIHDFAREPSVPTRQSRLISQAPGTAAARIQAQTTHLDVLVPYLPPGLLEMLRFDPLRMAHRSRGEFRPVTTLFCNFYGTQEIIQKLGASRSVEITAILNAHFSQMQQIIARYGGVIDKVDSYVVGHRIMALFGAPRAHVDDPERAVRAAWEMQNAMAAFRALETSAGTFALKQRIGINTGRVFAGNMGSDSRHEYTVMGDEVNLTARLMSLADEGQTRISQSTAAQVSGSIVLDALSPVQVKGKSRPVPSYELRGLATNHSTAQFARQTPLFGRDADWANVWHVAEEARAGRAQVLDIHGDMGLGKSRLTQQLMERWQVFGAAYSSTCVAYGRHIPYAPWQDLLSSLVLNGIRPEESVSATREELEQNPDLAQATITKRLSSIRPEWTDGIDPIDWAPLLYQLLGLPVPESKLLQALDPRQRQQNLQRIVHGLIFAEAEERPTLLVIDDLQWIDQASLSLLNYTISRLPESEARLLICIAHRPIEQESDPDESDQAYLAHTGFSPCTTLALQPLSEQASADLLDTQIPRIAHERADQSRWQRIRDQILENAQGNPLFIIEMAHALIENGLTYDPETGAYRTRSDLDQMQVPDTISRAILSRLDRLGEQDRNILRVASVIGHEFQQWLLQAVYPYRIVEPELERCLFDLCAKELLDRNQLLYLFRHVMTRQVAYESLLYAERRALHRQIAASIERQDAPEKTEHAPASDHFHPSAEVLAHHYTLAEDWPQALVYQLQAGLRAQEIYANEDAIHRFRQALQIAERVPDSEALQQQAHAALGDILAIVGDYDGALTHMDRAIHLVLALEATSEQAARRLADLFCRTASIYEKKSDYSTAFDWLQGGLLALEGLQAIEAARIYSMGAGIYHRQGDNAEALQWCENSLKLAGRLADADSATEPDRNAARDALAHAYYLQGAIYLRYADYAQAAKVCQKSLDLYEQLGNLPGAGAAHNNLASAFFDLGNWPQAAEHYRRALQIVTQIGNVHESGLIANNLGEVYRYRGELDRAQAYYEQSLHTWQALGSLYGQAFLHMNLAAVALKRSEWTSAIAQLEQCQRLCAQIDAQDFTAEAYRYLAEAWLGRSQNEDPQSQAHIAQALDYAFKSVQLAQRQEMKLEEGATRRVLGRIYRRQRRYPDAEQELLLSLHTLEALDNQYQIGQTLVDLAQLYQELGQTPESRQSMERATAIFEHLGAKLDLEQARQLG